ncbi:BLUF domain-containing protein [Celeribacter persicus]|uniref:FAD-dependent sensor of blue light n=1 Tax=Celeribacter persicus TaxID=1651082 RepID=A0A2T5HS81_9RHOB|nr:BLUF domain-containing protein [Celeribacter persicus]PTQ74426.1 FAD-dependent sensor of blue light [Celeribacter persicus]
MTRCLQLLYRSVARYEDFHPSDLDILREAVRFNADHGITGMLLRVDEQFLQALHGPGDEIDALVARIKADPRHQHMEILLREETVDMSPFGNWSMAYDSLMGFEQNLGLQEDGHYPEISPERARDLIVVLAKTATSVDTYGSAFPYTRLPGEEDAAYLERLDGLA